MKCKICTYELSETEAEIHGNMCFDCVQNAEPEEEPICYLCESPLDPDNRREMSTDMCTYCEDEKDRIEDEQAEAAEERRIKRYEEQEEAKYEIY